MILIGTPAYNGLVHIDYLKSVLGLVGIVPFEVMNIGNESLITRARNNIINYFNITPKYSHLLFLDGDVEIAPCYIQKLLSYQLDVVAAPVPLKGVDSAGNPVYNVWNLSQQNENSSLCKADAVGTAAMLLSRNAVNILISESPIYVENDVPKYDVFRVGVVNGRYTSEDYFICNVLRNAGIQIHVDVSISTHHQGMIKI